MQPRSINQRQPQTSGGPSGGYITRFASSYSSIPNAQILLVVVSFFHRCILGQVAKLKILVLFGGIVVSCRGDGRHLHLQYYSAHPTLFFFFFFFT